MKRPTIIPSPAQDRVWTGQRLVQGVSAEEEPSVADLPTTVGKIRAARNESTSTRPAVREQRIASIMKPQAQRIRALVGRGMSRGYLTTRSVRCAFGNDGLKSRE
jgi:hypothetical protein